jgi:predicted ATPase/signal transduction histidine kinase
VNIAKPTIDISQYALEVLRYDEEFVLYRGSNSNEPGLPSVLLLAAASTQGASATLKKMEHEYSLRDDLDPVWAIRPQAVSEQRGRAILVFEDPGRETLDRMILCGPMELSQFLGLAIGVAAALGGLHKKDIIHKDLKPANIFVNPQTDQVRLMGFGIASRFPRERQAPDAPEIIAGTLAYMAPEQTGRMNRSIDSRSDLYTLGVVLYQMVTGALPFATFDPMEIVHCHIAGKPISPSVRLESVPEQVSAVIMKLLAKRAEERYQTATGVESDLRRCLAEWETHHQIVEFPLGENDVPGRLLIPEKLYGRDTEVGVLVSAFDRVVTIGKPELLLVSGYSGIGKSAVVRELHKTLTLPRGFFASGKFDRYKSDIPYSTLAQAFQGLIRQLLGKNDKDLAPWRDALREALGANGCLIVELIPELEHIIGQQRAVPELPPLDARRRFQLAFRRFVGVFAQPSRPLVLFLDDLQWLDTATLDIIEDLLHADLHHLLFIGAYRDNEVDSLHPLLLKLEAFRLAGVTVHEIRLAPLNLGCVTELVVNALHVTIEQATPLARLVHDKTAGNPFFVIQFLRLLVDDGLLVFASETGQWSSDLDRIHHERHTENVVDLMAGKLARMPARSRKALEQLACIGNTVDINMLSAAFDLSEEEIHADMWEAVRLDLVHRERNSYKFLHDRVQEAAYSLIPESSRAPTHLRIGRLLRERTPLERRHEAIFEIVNQLNRGALLITDPGEREELAELNLVAGKRAKASTAYGSACAYLHTGIELLADNTWETRYELAFALRLECAECAYLLGNLDEAEGLIAVLLAKGASKTDQAFAYSLTIDLHVMRSEFPKAIESAIDCLGLFGIEMPAHPTREQVEREYENVWNGLGGRPIETLADLPPMTDPEVRAAMRVLSVLFGPAMFTDINLVYLYICHMVNLTLRYGTTDASSTAYAWFGVFLGPVFGRYKDGCAFGRLAAELVERPNALAYKAKTYLGLELIAVWTQPLETAIDHIRKAFHAGVENGDPTIACYSANHIVTGLLAHGEDLDTVWLEAQRALEFTRKAKFRDLVDLIMAQQQFIDVMRGRTNHFSTFSDALFDEEAFESQLTEGRHPIVACWYWILKLQARFMCQDYEAAITAAGKAKALLWSSEAQIQLLDYHFYSALALATDCENLAPDAQRNRHETLTLHLHQLEEWAKSCSQTFCDRFHLAAAEVARLEGRLLDAEQFYEEAIHASRRSGFVQNEALAAELAARFYAARGLSRIANIYLQDARYGYLRWGAEGKVRQLDESYPQLRQGQPTPVALSTIAGPVEQLDLSTVIKVSQAVSAEIDFVKLIDKLLRTAIEHAGAGRGLLILPEGDELHAYAEAITRGENITVYLREDTQRPVSKLPESLVRYVARAREAVLLEDASAQTQFSTDPYVAGHHASSILCLPLTNQAKLIGVLYLENDLTPYAFTARHVMVLKLLASQAAISLENSRLYREQERARAEIRTLKDQLSRANQVAMVGELTASIAHEVNQPLAAIVANAEAGLQWLEREVPNLDGASKALRRIERDGCDAAEIVKRVRALFRRATPQSGPRRLEELVTEVLKLLENEVARRRVSVVVEIERDLPPVLCDGLQIQQVILNLMVNAMDALDDMAQPRKSIRIVANSEGIESVVLRIRDYGMGVKTPSRLFETFFTTKEKGLGMGLAISLSIVAAHGGQLWFEPTDGDGSTFCFRLPIEISKPTARQTAET